MRGTIPLGRFGGVPVGAHWSALIGVVLLGQLLAMTVLPMLVPGRSAATYWAAGGAAALAFILSLLAHELAHAVVARRNGLEVRRITIWLLGGVAEFADRPQRAGMQVRIALVGPMVSLVLAGLFAAASWLTVGSGGSALVAATLSWLASINLMLGVFNLLPGTPLDGGRVLHGLIWWRSGDRERATRIASGAGQFLGALLAGLGILLVLGGRGDGLWLLLVGWFLAGVAAGERRHEMVAGQVAGLRVGDVMNREPQVAPGWWTVQAFVDQLMTHHGPQHRVFPVVDLQGQATGVVGLADLAAVAAPDRVHVPVRSVMRRQPAELVVGEDTPLEKILSRPLVPGRDLVLVERDGRLAGLVGPGDLARTVELQALSGEPAGRTRGQGSPASLGDRGT
ncbi:site-2 protease family protein [Pseudonocardia asaccharolytica]|uniref:Zinc metalloprotease n=2 Tax=Pseudonocardia asaccharolytica TaxID=54010 RepID=A0A511D7H4_9PSEU|nr:site-2 protease family protein [Pseudonocardia asaccharolytica]GEL20373.1 putative zinc metalloprotease Rip3 [Pseudonocardia asaccharolytica DSM 44247 = NBRC 16224]